MSNGSLKIAIEIIATCDGCGAEVSLDIETKWKSDGTASILGVHESLEDYGWKSSERLLCGRCYYSEALSILNNALLPEGKEEVKE